MKTKLYKMWTDFTSQPKFKCMLVKCCEYIDKRTGEVFTEDQMQDMLQAGKADLHDYTVSGLGSFYTNRLQRFTMDSSEYTAWNAWMHVPRRLKSTTYITHLALFQFIFLNWDLFKDSFPEGCIWLDMRNLSIDDITPDDLCQLNSFTRVLAHDLYALRYRRGKKSHWKESRF